MRNIPAYQVVFSSLMCLTTVNAAVIVTSAGEAIKFNDGFSDNANAWTNVVGTSATTKAKIADGVWTPWVANDGGTVSSTTTAIPQLNLANGAISVYMNVNIEDYLKNPANARFGITLNGKGGSSDAKFDFQIQPGTFTGSTQYPYLQYRNTTGGTVTDNLGYTNGFVTSGTAYYTFKLTITAGTTAGTANMQAYYYNGSSYIAFPGGPAAAGNTASPSGANSTLARTGTGANVDLFTSLSINSRNGTATDAGKSNAPKFDQVVITQVPEPSATALVLLGLMSVMSIRRRNN